MDEYLAVNRANWDDRARAHAASPTCDGGRGEWRLTDRPWCLAATYTLRATRR